MEHETAARAFPHAPVIQSQEQTLWCKSCPWEGGASFPRAWPNYCPTELSPHLQASLQLNRKGLGSLGKVKSQD